MSVAISGPDSVHASLSAGDAECDSATPIQVPRAENPGDIVEIGIYCDRELLSVAQIR